MNPPAKRTGEARPERWLEHARSDLALARLGAGSDVLPEQLCFHAQQAVEEAIRMAVEVLR
ncbi:MAG: HEPN domain-containing protein [Deltaproteobacteria bacterium]|nr:HEPN domain-containing protein [Deltaproteobacteria bacterium]